MTSSPWFHPFTPVVNAPATVLEIVPKIQGGPKAMHTNEYLIKNLQYVAIYTKNNAPQEWYVINFC